MLLTFLFACYYLVAYPVGYLIEEFANTIVYLRKVFVCYTEHAVLTDQMVRSGVPLYQKIFHFR